MTKPLLLRHQHTATLSPSNPAAVTVEPGQRFTVEVPSAMGGVCDNDLQFHPKRSEKPNPTAGPIAIDDIRAGETIAVFIHRIRPVGYGFAKNRAWKQLDSHIELDDGSIQIPYRPNIGTIGVAPSSEDDVVDNTGCAAHGGNIDCTDMTEGSVIFFKARLDGGMLGLGDVHTAMGDGEVEGTGIESAADIELTIRKAEISPLDCPWIVFRDRIMTVAASTDYQKAIHESYEFMIEAGEKIFNLDREQMGLRISPAGEVLICQCTCPTRTFRTALPLELLGFPGGGSEFIEKFVGCSDR